MSEDILALGRSARHVAGLIRRSPRVANRALQARALRAQVERDWQTEGPLFGQPHPLNREVIVSLTSYPPRFPTLVLTLKCLLRQTMAPDRIILWLAPEDVALLPADVLTLQQHGLQVRAAQSWRSFTKIIPALINAPDAFIATADDDVHYSPTWLQDLIEAYRDPTEIVCHRAHRIALSDDGLPRSYARWRHNDDCEDSSDLLFPTGVGGVLYPPGALHADAIEANLFLDLCPQADDVWLYFMGRRVGATYRRVGPARDMISWPGSQTVSLLQHNVGPARGNDVQIARMIERYGFPPRP